MEKYLTASEKRRREKLDKAGYIIDLEKYLSENLNKLKELDSKVLVVKKIDTFSGDEWYSEQEYGHVFYFSDATSYRFTTIKVVEDDENWAQAESYTYNHFSSNEKGNRVTVNELLNKFKAILK